MKTYTDEEVQAEIDMLLNMMNRLLDGVYKTSPLICAQQFLRAVIKLQSLLAERRQRSSVELPGYVVHKAIDAWNEYGGHAITRSSYGRMRAALEAAIGESK